MRGFKRMHVGAKVGLVMAIAIGVSGGALAYAGGKSASEATVADGVEMSTLAGVAFSGGASPCSSQREHFGTIAKFSPDGKSFVVVVQNGDVKKNLVDYTMLLWNTRSIGSEGPRVLLQMGSSSLRPAIDPDTIAWSRNGSSLMFLGEEPGKYHALYSLNVAVGRLRTVATDRTGNVVNFSRATGSDNFAYETAMPLHRSLWNAHTARHGLVVTWQPLSDIETGRVHALGLTSYARLFVAGVNGTREIYPPPGTHFISAYPGYAESDNGVSISPNGRYVVAVGTLFRGKVPRAWRRYRDPTVKSQFAILHLSRMEGNAHVRAFYESLLERYLLIDRKTGKTRILIDSPLYAMLSDRVVWSPDSRHVILSEMLWPVTRKMARSAVLRASRRSTVEVNVATGAMKKVNPRCKVALRWKKDTLTCSPTQSFLGSIAQAIAGNAKAGHRYGVAGCAVPKRVTFREAGDEWREEGAAHGSGASIYLKEARNVSPKLYYRLRDGQGGLLWDLNPQFKTIRLAPERLMTWEWAKGHRMTGGLYYPAHYVPGRRYPLVIQTHEFSQNKYSYFGGMPTAFAAQPLAARNMFVLQLNDIGDLSGLGTSRRWQLSEVRNAMRMYKTAIVYLNRRGLIDPRKVGIIGFSHTCFFVHWALTHDPKLFAAASVTEGGDGSFMQYMTGAQNSVDFTSLYPGPPFGRSLASWVKRAPAFHMDRVLAPLLIGVDHHSVAYDEWEWLQGLRRLKKPVYMVVLDGRSQDSHMLVKPWDRLISSGEEVDWFDFWLNGHESSNPAKAKQYARWRRLRVLSRLESSQAPISWKSLE